MQALTLAFLGTDDIVMVSIVGGLVVAIVLIVLMTIRSIALRRSVEQSRREIAAYVAEGSMTAEDGAKLIAAGEDQPGRRSSRC